MTENFHQGGHIFGLLVVIMVAKGLPQRVRADIVPSKQSCDLLEHLVHRIDFQMAAFGAGKQIICRCQVYGVRLDQVL